MQKQLQDACSVVADQRLALDGPGLAVPAKRRLRVVILQRLYDSRRASQREDGRIACDVRRGRLLSPKGDGHSIRRIRSSGDEELLN